MRASWNLWRVAAALLFGTWCTSARDAAAQVPEPPPVIPDTNVEAEPPTIPETNVEAAPQETFDPNQLQDPSLFDSVIQGTRLSSPIVDGYRAGSSTAGTLMDLPDSDVPATVTTITKSVLRDQQALQFNEVIRNAGGLSAGGDGLFADRIYMRGFELQSRDFRKDGFLDPTYVPRDFQNVERIEILKGPASVLYGSGSPAGMVNIVTKKPLDAVFSDFGFTFGSWSRARYTIDANGRANESGTVLYRLNMAQEDAESYRDFDFLSRTQISPTVSWQMNDSTKLTWSGEWHRDNRRGYQGVPVLGGNPLGLPPNTYVGEPANDYLHTNEFRQTLMLQHELSDNWTFNMGGSSLFYSFPGSVTAASGNPAPGFFPNVPEPFFYRSRNDIVKDNEQSQSMIANLAGDFYTGNLRHQAVVGMEYVYFDSDALYNFGAVNPIDVTNPVYLNPPTIPLGAAAFPIFRQQRVGGYLQDLVELTPQWKAMAGVRFDTVDFRYDRTLFFGGPPAAFSSEQQFNRVTPRAGLIFQPFADDTLALYGNYTQSFSPPGGGVYINPGNLKPILGEGYELGVKTLLTEGLSLNVAGFYSTRQNADLNTSSFFLTQVGEERSQGAEVNLLGQITERWNATANYTYADVRLYDQFDPTYNDKRQRNVPFNSANFWTRYNLVQDDYQTFGLALGLIYLDRRPGDLTNTFELPSYARWDMGAFYKRGRMNAALFAENIFDVQYAQSSITQYQVFQGAPVNLRAQVGISF